MIKYLLSKGADPALPLNNHSQWPSCLTTDPLCSSILSDVTMGSTKASPQSKSFNLYNLGKKHGFYLKSTNTAVEDIYWDSQAVHYYTTPMFQIKQQFINKFSYLKA